MRVLVDRYLARLDVGADPRLALVGECIDRLRRLNYSEKTMRDYAHTAHKFLARFPHLSLELVSPEHIERFLGEQRIAPETYVTYLERLSGFFKFLVRQKRLLRANPCADIERPRLPDRFRYAPTPEDVEAMRRACRTLEEEVLVAVMFYTGLRLSEVRQLRIRDLDLGRRQALVRWGKGAKDRLVVYPAHVADLLLLYTRERDPDDHVVRSPRRGRWPRGERWIEQTIRRLGTEAGVPARLSAHSMRHAFTRLMKTRGVPLEVAARLLGHASIVTTQREYGRLDISDLQAAYDRQIGGTL